MLLALLWPIRLAFYLLRLVLFYSYGFLVFLSKPGGRVLFPLLVIGLGLWQAEFVDTYLLTDPMIASLAEWIPVDPADKLGFGLSLVVVFVVAVWIVSLLLRPVLGALPPMRKPMPPLRRLRSRHRQKAPAPARIAVPKLSREFWGGEEKHLIRRLPPHLQKLLESKEDQASVLVDITLPPPEKPETPVAPPPSARRKPAAPPPPPAPPPLPKSSL